MEIPEGLFKNNINASDFSSCFSGCSSITEIPGVCLEIILIQQDLWSALKDVAA